MKTLMNNGFTAKDIFNTRTSSATIKNYIGVPLSVFGYAIIEDTDKSTSEVINVGYVKTNDGVIIGFKSGVCCDSLEALDEFVQDEDIDITRGEITIEFTAQTAKSGREFYTFCIID